MKKILTLAFIAVSAFALQAADAIFRIDLDGTKDQIVMTPEKSDDYNISAFNWLKDVGLRKYTLIASFKKVVPSTEWKDYDVTFIPAKSGTISITVGGQWAAKPEDRVWLLVNKVEVNDKLYDNGDFRKTWKHKDGRLVPNGFWFGKAAKYLPTAGEKGTPAVLVNHDNRLGFSMKVEAGKKYEIEFEVKAATPAQMK